MRWKRISASISCDPALSVGTIQAKAAFTAVWERRMPHLIVEYSANLERVLDIPRLVAAVHAAALETGVFPIGGIRTRAERRDIYAVADSHPDNAFIHVQARIGTGRTPEVRQRAAEQIFAAVKAETAEVFASRPLGLTFEIVKIDSVGSLKHNNLHDIVEARRKGSAA